MESIICSHCDIKFDSATSLKVHVQFNHGSERGYPLKSETTHTVPTLSPLHDVSGLGGSPDSSGTLLNTSYSSNVPISSPTSSSALSVSLYSEGERLKSNFSPNFHNQTLPPSLSGTPTPGSSCSGGTGSSGDLAISPNQQTTNMISYVEQSSPSAIIGNASHLLMQPHHSQPQHVYHHHQVQPQQQLYHNQTPQHSQVDMTGVKLGGDTILCGDVGSDYLAGLAGELENESSAEEIWDLDSNTVKRYNNPTADQSSELDSLGPLPPFSVAASSISSNQLMSDPYGSGNTWNNGSHGVYPRQSPARPAQHSMPGYPPPEEQWMMSAGSPTMGASKRGDDLKRLKTYQCEACDKWFTSSGHLKRHYNTTLHKNATRQKTSPLSTQSEGSPLSGSSSRPHSGMMPYPENINQPCSPSSMEISSRTPQHHSISTLNCSTSLSNNSSNPSQGLLSNNNNLQITNEPSGSPCNNNNALQQRNPAQSPFYQQQGQSSASPGGSMHPDHGTGKMTPSSPMHAGSPLRPQQTHLMQAVGDSQIGNHHGISPSSPAPGVLSNTPGNNQDTNLSGEDSNQSSGKVQNVTDCLLYGRPPSSGYHSSQSPANMYSPDSAVIVAGSRAVSYSNDIGMPHNNIYTLSAGQQHRGISPMDPYTQQQPQQYSYHSNYGNDYHSNPSPHHPNGGLPPFQSAMYSQGRYSVYGQHLSMSLLDDMDMKKEMDLLSSSDHLGVGEGLEGIPTCSTPSDCGTSTPGLGVPNPTSAGNGGGDFRCNECNKGFNRICYLKQHNKSFHNGEKPYKCGQCGKRFPGEVLYQEHLAKHAGDKPYKCDVCPKQFNHKTDLRRHMCLHTGEKPFSCDVCGKGFIREDRMIKHSDTHKKKQPILMN